MSLNKILSSIRLRTDTVTNWFANRSKIIPKNELVVVDFENGCIGLKFGQGKSYQNTNFIKFLNLCTDTLSNGEFNFTFPKESGTLALSEDVVKKYDSLMALITSLSAGKANKDEIETKFKSLMALIATLSTQVKINSDDIEELKKNPSGGKDGYPFVNKELTIQTINVGGESIKAYVCTLDNYSINIIRVESTTYPIYVYMPKGSENCRDLLARFEVVTASAPTLGGFIGSDGESIDFENVDDDDKLLTLEIGVNLFNFIETKR